MKTTQYVRQERNIAAADSGGIRERWLWGLRLLRDQDAFAPGSSQLKPGRAEELAKALAAAGRRVSEREIRYRLHAARTYPFDSQIRQASAEFRTWWGLINADFPAYEAEPEEPPADHRTDEERRRDRNRELAEWGSEQLTLFPLDRFEPATTTLKELVGYAAEMAELTARFAARDRDRFRYIDSLIEAVDGDLSATWGQADDALRRSADPPPLERAA